MKLLLIAALSITLTASARADDLSDLADVTAACARHHNQTDPKPHDPAPRSPYAPGFAGKCEALIEQYRAAKKAADDAQEATSPDLAIVNKLSKKYLESK